MPPARVRTCFVVSCAKSKALAIRSSIGSADRPKARTQSLTCVVDRAPIHAPPTWRATDVADGRCKLLDARGKPQRVDETHYVGFGPFEIVIVRQSGVDDCLSGFPRQFVNG